MALPEKDSARIAKKAEKRAWGYVPVQVKVGKTIWKTGLRPKKEEAVYLLVLRAEVRKKEGIFEGDTIRFALSFI